MPKVIKKNKPKISVVIAIYKDALSIEIFIRRIQKVFALLKLPYEIIFVNDNSPDRAQELLENIIQKYPHIVAVEHSRNFSSQMAFTTGMLIATGDAVVLMDGDLQDPPELIPEFVELWKSGYQVVYGVRSKRADMGFKEVFYKLFYRVFDQLSYIKIPADAGDFSLMDKQVVETLNSMPERDRFIRGLRAWVGFRQIGVEYTRSERFFGNSTNNWIKNFQWATKGIFSFSYLPLQWMTLLSLCISFLAVVGMILQLIGKILDPSIPHGVTTIILLVLFFGAVQLMCLSILGEYIGKILEEVKHRPHAIIKKIQRSHKS